MGQAASITLNAKDNTKGAIAGAIERLKQLKASAAQSNEGVKKLENGFENLATDALGLNGALGQMGESLMAFAGGGLLVTGAVAGLGLIVTAFMGLKKAQDDAKLSLDAYQVSLAALNGMDAQLALAQSEKKLLEANRKTDKNGALFGFGEGLRSTGNPILGAAGAFLQSKALEGVKELTDANTAYNAALKRVLDLQKQKAENDKKDADAAAKAAKATRDKAQAEAEKALQEATQRKERAVNAISGGAKGLIEYQKAYGSLTPAQLETLRFIMGGLKTQEQDALNRGDFGGAAGFKDLQNQLQALTPKVDVFKMVTGKTTAELSAQLEKDLNKSINEGFKVNTDALNEQLAKLNTMEDVLNQTTGAWFSMWSAIGAGVSPLRAIGQAFVQSIVAYSGKKAAENVALGFENLAKAASALANPLTAILAPGFKAAATGHFVAAAKWGAIGGAGAVAGGAIGGGGSSGGGYGGSPYERTTQSTEGLGRGTVNVTFPEGLIDLTNPATQRQFTKILNDVAGNRQVNFVGA